MPKLKDTKLSPAERKEMLDKVVNACVVCSKTIKVMIFRGGLTCSVTCAKIYDEPVVVDFAKTRNKELMKLNHVHDLDGTCIKRRAGERCTV